MIEHLFVYGTLGPGRPNAHVMERIGGIWQKAHIMGALVEAGWGAEQGYPALKLDPAGEPVEGFLFSSENHSAHWPELDEFEGTEYARVDAAVVAETGEIVRANVYILNTSSQR